MPSCLRLLLLVAVVAGTGRFFTPATSEDNPFTTFDCPSPTASPAGTAPLPVPSPFKNTTNGSSSSSNFLTNVVALLEELPSAAAPTGFASLSRGDTAPDDCATYLQSAVLGIYTSCNSRRRAAIWYDKCFQSYADTNATTAYEDTFRRRLYNVGKVNDTDAFERTYFALMARLANHVVNGTGAASSSSPSTPMFATGEAVYDPMAPNGTMYGLVQCMRDRTAAECARCLQYSVQQLPREGWCSATTATCASRYTLTTISLPHQHRRNQHQNRQVSPEIAVVTIIATRRTWDILSQINLTCLYKELQKQTNLERENLEKCSRVH